jgi:MFS family permease
VAGVPFRQIYFAFAAGYLLSYLLRTVNAVISPELSRDLALNPASLGLLTSAYFLAFAAMQVPVGILLDRYGPRRVEPVLLALAALGAALFAAAESLPGLVVARTLIGAGVCACLMSPLKAIATWYPPERQASFAGWVMVAGGLGALLATVPVELALRVTTWRTVFVVLAVVTLAVAVAIWWRVPDMPRSSRRESLRAQFAAVYDLLLHPRFWWIAPLASFAMGSFMAIQGLWAVPWMMEVTGGTRASAADHLLVMNGVIMAGYVALGALGQRLVRLGVHARHLFAGGFALNIGALALIVAEVPGSYLWWSLLGLGAASNVLAFTVLNEGFGRAYAGRTNTTLNLLMFGGSFVMQWGIGVMAELAGQLGGLDAAGALRVTFMVVLAGNIAAYAWFAHGWRRHRHAVSPATT